MYYFSLYGVCYEKVLFQNCHVVCNISMKISSCLKGCLNICIFNMKDLFSMLFIIPNCDA
jgi:hypothetical protein